jgi:arylformamidase
MDCSPELVERGYNNRAAVADHPRFIAQYTSLSEAARERTRRNAICATARTRGGPRSVRAAGRRAARTSSSTAATGARCPRTIISFVAGPMVEQGIAVAVIDYDLCPRCSISTIVDECRRAHGGVPRRPEFGAAAEPVVVAGHLSGRPPRGDDVRDELAGGTACRRPSRRRHVVRRARSAPLMHFSFNEDFALDAAEAWRMSRSLSRTDKAPLLIACGADETSEFLRQSQLLGAWPANRRPDAGRSTSRRSTFHVSARPCRPASALTQATLAFLTRLDN